MLSMFLVAQASAQSLSFPIPDFQVADSACVWGTGAGGIPCIEAYAYRFSLTGMQVDMALTSFTIDPGVQWWGVDGAITSSVNSRATPFEVQVYTSVGGLIGIQQTCQGWVEPFTITTGVDAQVIVRPLRQEVDFYVPPLDSDFSDLDGNDIVLTGQAGQGLDCTIGAIDAALGAIPGSDLSVFNFIVAAIVPAMESTIAGLNDELEAVLDSLI